MAVVPEDKHQEGRWRGVYVMFIVLGVFAAGGYFDAREAREELREQKRATIRAEKTAEILAENQDKLLVASEKASKEREALSRRSLALERLLLRSLSSTSDPELADAFADFQREMEQERSSRPSPSPQAQPRPSSAPNPSPRPPASPQPSPTPAASPSPQPAVCVTVLGQRVCSPAFSQTRGGPVATL